MKMRTGQTQKTCVNWILSSLPILRIGGDSTDWTWWPVPHMATPGGVKYTLNKNWLEVTSALAKSLGISSAVIDSYA